MPYCTKCGKELKVGELCGCQNPTPAETEKSVAEEAKAAAAPVVEAAKETAAPAVEEVKEAAAPVVEAAKAVEEAPVEQAAPVVEEAVEEVVTAATGDSTPVETAAPVEAVVEETAEAVAPVETAAQETVEAATPVVEEIKTDVQEGTPVLTFDSAPVPTPETVTPEFGNTSSQDTAADAVVEGTAKAVTEDAAKESQALTGEVVDTQKTAAHNRGEELAHEAAQKAAAGAEALKKFGANAGENIANISKGVFSTMKDVIRKPGDKIGEYVTEGDYKPSIYIFVIAAIVTLVIQIVRAIRFQIPGDFLHAMGTLLSSILVILTVYIVIALAAMIFGKSIGKKKVTFGQGLAVASLFILMSIVGTLCANVLSLFNLYGLTLAGNAIARFFEIVGVVYVLYGMKEFCDNKNKMPYLMGIMFAVIFFISGIFTFLL